MFKAFPSIGSMRDSGKTARWIGLDVVRFKVSTKIHGTNAGIRIQNGQITAQSRKRDLSLTSDNKGFAFFVHQNKDLIKELFGTEDQFIYGEWCGPSIQKIVALNEMKERHFVAFKVLKRGMWSTPQLPNEGLIRSIAEFGIIEVKVDFSKPQEAYGELLQMMESVEKCCPVAKGLEGVEGIGEGFVASLDGPEGLHHLWFKVKGDEHNGKTGRRAPEKVSSIDVIKANNAESFMREFFHLARLNQGLEYLEEMCLPQNKSSTRAFIKWCYSEFEKEGVNSYVEAGLDPSYYKKALSTTCAKWYISKVGDF